MRGKRTHLLIFLVFVTNAMAQTLPAQVIDLSGEAAFAPRSPSLTINQVSLSIVSVPGNQLLIASDLYDRCADEKNGNIYTILAIDLLKGVVLSRRTIAALPESFQLILDAHERPLLISQSSIQILDQTSLNTKETISFDHQQLHDEGRSEDKDGEPCPWNNFRVSATPDSKYITVATLERGGRTTDLYQIDGETLKFAHKAIDGSLWEFRVGYEGIYEHKGGRRWYLRSTAGSIPICTLCDFLDVLSGSSVVTTAGERVSVQNGAEILWDTKFSGMRDSFASDRNGNRFAILAAEGNGPFRPTLREALYVFDVPHRTAKRIQRWAIKQSGPIQGGERCAVALSSDGLKVVVFINGRLIVIPGA